jgi:TPR repeat protein
MLNTKSCLLIQTMAKVLLLLIILLCVGCAEILTDEPIFSDNESDVIDGAEGYYIVKNMVDSKSAKNDQDLTPVFLTKKNKKIYNIKKLEGKKAKGFNFSIKHLKGNRYLVQEELKSEKGKRLLTFMESKGNGYIIFKPNSAKMKKLRDESEILKNLPLSEAINITDDLKVEKIALKEFKEELIQFFESVEKKYFDLKEMSPTTKEIAWAIQCDQDTGVENTPLGIWEIIMGELETNLEESDTSKINSCEKAISLNPKLLRLQYQYAMGLLSEEKELDAAAWFLKAGDNGHAYSQLAVGIFYSDGIGGLQDYKLALKWFQKAAEQGVSEAYFHMANMYEKDDRTGMPQNNSLNLLIKAGEGGYIPAQNRLCRLYFDGTWQVSQDLEKAAAWCQSGSWKKLKTISKDTPRKIKEGALEAAYRLGLLYENGHGGVGKDLKKAREQFRWSGKKGHKKAYTRAATFWENGIGGKADFKEAFKIYKSVAINGDYEAQHHLGHLYEEGKGVKQNSKKAKFWKDLAIQNGFKLGK